jgi:peptidoglycan lytic transglycosylase G
MSDAGAGPPTGASTEASTGTEAGTGAGTEEEWAEPRVPPRRRAREARARRRRRSLFVLFAVLAVLLLPVALAAGWFVWELSPPGDAGDRVEVVIQPGWGVNEAGDALQSQGVIGSSLAFQIWARLSGTHFQAGTYRLREHLGVREAAAALGRGPQAPPHQTLALPPGLTLSQIADRVAKLPGHSRDAFLQAASSGAVRSAYQPPGVTSLEGLTWPDTYFVGEHDSDEQILRTLVSQFDKHAQAAKLSSYDALKIASLVQAEAGAGDDAPLVSAVIANRLQRGTQLQIDATLCYAKGGCPPVPNNADKQIDSPYNTYKVTGLPPTPIMTVTDGALTAALHPASVPYLFYVTGKDGVTRFATTFQEHQRNIDEHGVSGE